MRVRKANLVASAMPLTLMHMFALVNASLETNAAEFIHFLDLVQSIVQAAHVTEAPGSPW